MRSSFIILTNISWPNPEPNEHTVSPAPLLRLLYVKCLTTEQFRVVGTIHAVI